MRNEGGGMMQGEEAASSVGDDKVLEMEKEQRRLKVRVIETIER